MTARKDLKRKLPESCDRVVNLNKKHARAGVLLYNIKE